jgi:hypothetical protein
MKIAYPSIGESYIEPVSLYVMYPERWVKQHFSYKTEWNDKTKQLEKQLQGTAQAEDIYDLPFTKENLKDLYNQRESDSIQFVVKKEDTGDVRQVEDMSSLKRFELTRDLSFEDLFKAEYMPAAVKAELRQEAVSQGLIHGTVQDFSNTTTNQPSGKGVYK